MQLRNLISDPFDRGAPGCRMAGYKMLQTRKKDLAPISCGLTINTLAILLRIAPAIEGININKQAQAILLRFRIIHLIAGVADTRDRINIILVGGKMHQPKRKQRIAVFPEITKQLLIVFPRHAHIHIVIPGNKALMADRTEKSPEKQEIAQSLILTYFFKLF